MVEAHPGAWCDPCLAPLVKALNEGGIETVASCCGHGRSTGSVCLADGRVLEIHPGLGSITASPLPQKTGDEFRLDISNKPSGLALSVYLTADGLNQLADWIGQAAVTSGTSEKQPESCDGSGHLYVTETATDIIREGACPGCANCPGASEEKDEGEPREADLFPGFAARLQARKAIVEALMAGRPNNHDRDGMLGEGAIFTNRGEAELAADRILLAFQVSGLSPGSSAPQPASFPDLRGVAKLLAFKFWSLRTAESSLPSWDYLSNDEQDAKIDGARAWLEAHVLPLINTSGTSEEKCECGGTGVRSHPTEPWHKEPCDCSGTSGPTQEETK